MVEYFKSVGVVTVNQGLYYFSNDAFKKHTPKDKTEIEWLLDIGKVIYGFRLWHIPEHWFVQHPDLIEYAIHRYQLGVMYTLPYHLFTFKNIEDLISKTRCSSVVLCDERVLDLKEEVLYESVLTYDLIYYDVIE